MQNEPEYGASGDDYFEELSEPIIGLGFVAIQEYLTLLQKTFRIEKKTGLFPLGKEFRAGLTFSKIANEAANYFKHHNEWEARANESSQQKKMREETESLFKMLNIDL